MNRASMTPGPKQCARCGASFICKVDDLPNCQCVGVDLAPEMLAEIDQAYGDCLCARCLHELAGRKREPDVLLSD